MPTSWAATFAGSRLRYYGELVDPQTLWRGQRDTRRGIWARWLLVSLLVHAPITPLAGLIGLVGLLLPDMTEDDEPPPALTEIPVDLLSEEPGAGAVSAPPPAPAPAVAASEPAEPLEPPKKKRPPRPELRDGGSDTDAGIVDAGAPDAAIRDAGTRDSGPSDAGATPLAAADAGPVDAGPVGVPDAGDAGAGVGDPFAVAGGARTVVDSNANVSVNISTEKLRGHKLGPSVGALLAGVYQWRDFFGPTGIDPVRDTDAIWIWGPQFRRSADVAAIVQHRLGAQRMRAALDRLVHSDADGSWADAGVPVALAHADGAPRAFVMPSPTIVVLSTEALRPSAQRLKLKALPALPGATVALARIKTPWRAFKGLNFRVPHSIAWAKVAVEPTADGGASIEIEAADESADAAREHASDLGSAITAATQLDLGVWGDLIGRRVTRFVQSVSFDARGSHIHGRITLSEQQVVMILGIARERLAPPPPRPASSARTASPPASAEQPRVAPR